MGRVLSMEFLVLFTPKDTAVKTEHIERRHCRNHCHNPTHDRAELEACRQYLIFGEEPGERGNTCNGKTCNQERDVCHRHVLAQPTHSRHLVAVYRMDNATCTEEEQRLEHGMCK